MLLIKPSVEIITEPDMFKRIEIAARTCYKSEDKTTDGSAAKMVQNLIKRGHESPLEHSNIVIRCDATAGEFLIELIEGYTLVTHIPHFIKTDVMNTNEYLFAGNLRAWRSIVKYYYGVGVLYQMFNDRPGFEDIKMAPNRTDYGSFSFIDPPPDNPALNIITAGFVCDRGVSHELVRHRLLAISQESSRYCNYGGGVTFIEPWWWPQQESSDTALMRMAMQASEDAYVSLINSGSSPQKARAVLLNMLKTEVVATGTVEYWKTCVLPLRLSKAAHPDIRRVMEMFCQQLGWDPNEFRKE